MSGRALRLGVSGGIGSGKSTVCQWLGEMGACVVDADAISRDCTAANGTGLPAIRAAFGPDLFSGDGTLDRGRLRSLVFSDALARKRLEAILHPLIASEIDRQTALAMAQGVACIVFDIPLLVESSRWRKNLDRVLIVDCREQTQIERVMRRSGLQRAEVEKIMAAQSPRGTRLQAADFVLFNEAVNLGEVKANLGAMRPLFGL